MSGGHLDDYGYFRLLQTIDAIENFILKNNSEQINDFVEKIEPYSDVTIDRFREAVDLLKRAYIYAHRIDWLESGDDSEEDFHTRLTEELIKLEQ